MFLKKNFQTKNSKIINFRFDKFNQLKKGDDSIIGANETKSFYNFSISSGALTQGFGFKKLQLPVLSQSNVMQDFDVTATEIKALWFFVLFDNLENIDKYYIVYLDQNLKMFFFNTLGNKFMYDSTKTFTQIPNAAPFRINSDNDTLFLASASDQTVGLNGSGTQVYDNIPKFVSACWHGPYFFLITVGANNELMYSESRINIWNDDNVSTIEIPGVRGGLTKLISLEDDLFIFREFGISKLSLYSADSKISVDNIYESNSYIYPNSIAKNGDVIIFLSDDGLFKLNGNSVSKIEVPFIDKIVSQNNSDCKAVCFKNKYFLACKLNANDSYAIGVESGQFVNNAVLIYDLSENTFDILRGVDVADMITIQTPQLNKLCAIFRGDKKNCIGELTQDGCFFGAPLKKVWQSVNTDFGYAFKDKRISEIIIKPGFVGKIIISSEGDNFSFDIALSNLTQRFRTNIFGKNFSISFISDSGSVLLSCPEISFKVFL